MKWLRLKCRLCVIASRARYQVSITGPLPGPLVSRLLVRFAMGKQVELSLMITKCRNHIFCVLFRGGRRWTCVGFIIDAGIFGLAVGIIKYIG